MKELIKKVMSKYKIIGAFILGVLVSGIVVYADTILSSREVSYDNSASGGNSNNVQGAIEELYEKSNRCTTGSCSLTESNFVIGYTYNQNKNTDNYCVTGNEVTCKRTDCYTSSAKTCPPGTIIDYIVSGSNNNKVRFHVMYDQGRTMTMQSQKNTVNSKAWYSTATTTRGPLTILAELETATAEWSNVNNQTYSMGTTEFGTGEFQSANTACTYSTSDYKLSCRNNAYTLQSRTAKSRMITAHEASATGCLEYISASGRTNGSCPIWMYNYLYESTLHGGTADSTSTDTAYWTMSAYANNSQLAFGVNRLGVLRELEVTYVSRSARAVVVVNK